MNTNTEASLVDKYGCDFMEEIIGDLLIKRKIDDEKMRKLLLNNNLIKKTTKIIITSVSEVPRRVQPHDTDKIRLVVKNGRQEILIFETIDLAQTTEIMKEIRKKKELVETQ